MNRALAAARGVQPGWLIGLAAGVGLALAAAYVPVQAAFLALALAAATALVYRLGLRMGMWCLFVATIPIRAPLSVDIVGTSTLFLNDIILLLLTAACAWEHGVRTILRQSPSFRIGTFLAVLALGGLYTATRLKWGLAIALNEVGQTAAFYVAWHWIRSGKHARYTLLSFVIGLLPAVAVGLHQSTLSVREFQVRDSFVPAVAWDEAGNPHVRVFGTFGHPLHFSQALSIGAGLAAGLLAEASAAGRFLLAGAIGAIAFCNQYTYSIGGLVGTMGGLLTALFMSRRRWVLAALPVVLVVWALVAPSAFLLRIESSISGKNPTTVARLITYEQTFRVLRDHPLLGVGWGGIRTALEENYRITRDEVVSFTAENYFLERALATGVVGLGLTLLVCVLFFRNVRVRAPADPMPWPRAALLSGGVAFYLQAQFIPSADPESRYVLWILLALAERMLLASRTAAMKPPAEESA